MVLNILQKISLCNIRINYFLGNHDWGTQKDISPQNGYQNIIFNNHYVYQIICLLISLNIHIFFIKMVLAICDLDYFNMSLSVLKHGSRTVYH
jgi:hypothetical protein